MGKVLAYSTLVTMNLSFLNTNIPNMGGIEAVETILKIKNIKRSITSTFLRFVLTLKNFVFNCQMYRQIRGYAMGTECVGKYIYGYVRRYCCFKEMPR